MHGKQPIYRIYNQRHKQKIFSAISLKEIKSFSINDCKAEAQRYSGLKIKNHNTLNSNDIWIPWKKYKSHFPVYIFNMEGKEEYRIYVSSKTGEVIQETNRTKRLLTWIGAIPHYAWYRYLQLKNNNWKTFTIILSIAGCLMCLSGLIIGIFRSLKSNKRNKPKLSPYKKKWWKWHHISGLLFGIFAFSFILSGLISVSGVPNWLVAKEQKSFRKTWNQNNYNSEIYKDYIALLGQDFSQSKGIKRIEFRTIIGKPFLFKYTNSDIVPEVYTLKSEQLIKKESFSEPETRQYAKTCFDSLSFTLEKQKLYDNYYMPYSMGKRDLPVYKLSFNNKSNTTLYISVRSGEALCELNNNSRAKRWLYRGLHSFNTLWLKNNDIVRKVLITFISLGGLCLSLSGFILSIKKIKRKTR